MRSMCRGVLVAVVGALVFSALAAASASASSEWLLNEAPVTESTPVTFSLKSGTKFTMRDKTLVAGEVSLSCSSVTGKGTVAAAGAGTITEFKLAKCVKIKRGGCKEETLAEEESKEWVRAVSLSWKTQLHKTSGGEVEDSVQSGGSGEPGWEMECATVLGKVKDVCRSVVFSTELFHPEGSSEVEQLFPATGAPTLPCKAGAETVRNNAGEITAGIVLKGPEGKTLNFKP